jgi:DNA-binding NarL/FixJ family response regulator
MKGVLLVEDHGFFRQALAMFLEREANLEVVGEAGTIAEGRSFAASGKKFDIALVDLNLPDGDGVDVIRDLRQANPSACILVFTISLDAAHRARAIEAGADEVIGKETSLDELVATVKRVADA